jgi:outer membrane protein assembly factor BamB
MKFKMPMVIALVSLVSLGSAEATEVGEIAWSQQLSGAASLFSPAIGPDGTIYTSNAGAVTAYSPTGAMLWSVPTNTSLAPVSVGPDGTIYAAVGPVGANDILLALNPDGTERWTFEAGDSIHAGPNVGPDGNIYAIADAQFGGMGFFALNSEGALLWSNQGDPELSADTGQPHEIIMSNNRAFVAMATQGSGGGGGQPAGLWAFDFDGDQVFTLMASCQGQPVVDPLTGHLVTGNGICQEVHTYDSTNGSLIWSEAPPSQSPCSGLANIAVGPDGSIYTAFCYRAFWSLTATGSPRWFMDDFNFYFQLTRLGVAPDNSVVLELGRDLSDPAGRVRAFDPATGTLGWELILPDVGVTATSRPAFDAASNRAYFNAQNFSTDSSFLYAVDLPPRSEVTADLNGDGLVGAADLAILLGNWGPCGDCGDCTVGAADLANLLGQWG